MGIEKVLIPNLSVWLVYGNRGSFEDFEAFNVGIFTSEEEAITIKDKILRKYGKLISKQPIFDESIDYDDEKACNKYYSYWNKHSKFKELNGIYVKKVECDTEFNW